MDTGGGKRKLSSAQTEALDDATDVSLAPAPPGFQTTQTNAINAAVDEENRLDAVTEPPAPLLGREAEIPAGTRLGEYQIEGKIGEGGMGVVYAAIHPKIGKKAAIKVLRKDLCTDPAQVQRFIGEARAVNEIGHPNIVDIFAFDEMPDGRSYFVMEWLRGRSLRDRIDHALMPLPEICAVVKPLCRALEAAHEKSIIHRDLKPDNIFLVDVRGEAPTIKLLDFGIAKLLRSDRRLEKTATGAMIGTPQYIAPEQARGYAIDHRVDIYSLGGIIFELLIGRPPFVADNAMDVVAKHLLEEPKHMRELRADVPAELDALVYAMLAKDPNRRPSIRDVYATFERLSGTMRNPNATDLIGANWTSASTPVMASPLPQTPVASPSTPVAAVGAAPTLQHRLDTAPITLSPSRPGMRIALAAGIVLFAGLVGFAIVQWVAGGDEPEPEPAPIVTPVAPKPPDEPVIVQPRPAEPKGVDPNAGQAPPQQAVKHDDPKGSDGKQGKPEDVVKGTLTPPKGSDLKPVKGHPTTRVNPRTTPPAAPPVEKKVEPPRKSIVPDGNELIHN